MKKTLFLSALALITLLSSCKKDEPTDEPMLVFKYTFDENGVREDNLGNPATIPAGHAAQTPDFKKLGVHSIELINYVLSLPTEHSLIYKGETKEVNGVNGIDFNLEKLVSEGEVLVEIPIKDITPGTYNYLRNSLGYQEYVVDFLYVDPVYGPFNLTGNIASFVGFRTYIESFAVGSETIQVNDMKSQGYFAFHMDNPVPYTQTGEAPSTTVANPLDAVSPIPIGSCLVTGEFTSPLVITGNETEDVVVEVAISINQSFEWEDTNADGKYEPVYENVVDMGTRGLKATVK